MKQIKITLEDVFNLPDAVIYNPDVFKDLTSVSIDSRSIKRNSLFIAIKGERFDGHSFINAAIQKGAAAVMINRNQLKKIDDVPVTVITVPDTTKALGDISKIWRKKLKAKIIGLTGSAGKTTTKEILAKLLSEKYKVNKTLANNNNHIGVPLTILSTSAFHDILVAECGTNHFGEIPYTTEILQPDYALITNIGDSHLEFLKNRRGVLKEKSALFEITAKRKGKLFINYDDELLSEYSKKFRNKVKYGFNSSVDVQGKILSYDAHVKANLEIKTKSKKVNVLVPFPGLASAQNFLAASAVGLELGLTAKDIIHAVRRLKIPDKRMSISVFKKFTILNDTYNANPDSMKSAINILSMYRNRRRKIAVLGDMFELGEQSKKLHESLADYIVTQNISEILTTGKMMKHLTGKLKKLGAFSEYFESKELLKKYLKKVNLHNSVILVKGSRGMKMEEIVSFLEKRA